MPTYLCHGFRWDRADIRIFVIIHSLDDAAPNWIFGRTTSSTILDHLHATCDFLPSPSAPEPTASPSQPPVLKVPRDDDASESGSEYDVLPPEWSPVKLLEEFDVEETVEACRPYAYVADYAVRVDLSANIAEEMAKYEKIACEQEGPWLEKLRDQLQSGADILWYMVVCGDEERAVPDLYEEAGDETPTRHEVPAQHTDVSPARSRASSNTPGRQAGPSFDTILQQRPPPLKQKQSVAKGLRRLFGKKEHS